MADTPEIIPPEVVVQPISPELKHAFQDLVIDPATQEKIDAWNAKYGTAKIGRVVGYSYHGAQDHPVDELTGQETMDLMQKELTSYLGCQKPEDSEVRNRFVGRLLERSRNFGARQYFEDGGTHFNHWSIDFPSQRNTVETIISNPEAKKGMKEILDELFLNKVQALADPLIEESNRLGASLEIFDILPNGTMYGRPTSEFVELGKTLTDLHAKISARESSLLGIIRYRRDLVAKGNMFSQKLADVFSQAPVPVRDAIARQWNDGIADTFGSAASVSRIPLAGDNPHTTIG